MTRRTTLLAALLTLVVAAPAAAAPPPTDRPLTSPTITAALAAAADFWHVPNTATAYAATVDELESSTGTAGAIATATVDGHIWILDIAAGPSTPPAAVAICDVIAHELGHALGHDHRDDRDSVMWPSQRLSRHVYECWRRFTPLASLRRWRIPPRRAARARSTHAGVYAPRPRWLTH